MRSEDKKAIELLLAGYFHDLGKAVHKTGSDANTKHQQISREYLYSLKEVFVHDVEDFDNVCNLVNEHHILSPRELGHIGGALSNKNMLKLLILADWLDSTSRNKVESKYIPEFGKDKTIMNPLFMLYCEDKDKIDLTPWRFKKWYPISLLCRGDNFLRYIGEQSIESNKGDNKEEISDIIIRLGNLKDINDIKKKLEILDSIFFDYLFLISSSDYSATGDKQPLPDISLYYHSKMVGLLSYALYYMYKNHGRFRGEIEGVSNNDDLKRIERKINDGEYLPLGELYIDVSGIQKFITYIKNIEDLEGVAKLLRGRSVYLELLQKVIAMAVCDALDIPYNFIVKDNGGFIHILIPTYRNGNPEQTGERIKEIMENINKYLYGRFKGRIYLYYEYKYKKGEFKIYYKDVNELVEHLRGSSLKNRKFNKIESLEVIAHQTSSYVDGSALCNLCGVNEGNPCSLCDNIRKNFGGDIVKIDEVDVCVKESRREDGDLSLEIEDKRYNYYIRIGNEDKEYSRIYTYVLLPNKYDKEKGAEGNIYPFILTGLYVPLYKDKDNKDKVKDFNKIAGIDEGEDNEEKINENIKISKKELAIIKMDVNNLGMLIPRMVYLYEKLYTLLGGDKDTFSGITLSRKYQVMKFIEMFFTIGLRQIIDSDTRSRGNGNIRFEDTTYVLYAGGDDLVIVTKNINALRLIKSIHNYFMKLQSSHRVLTIKGAIRYFKPKYPLYLVYKELSELLELVEKDRYVKHSTEHISDKDKNYVGLNKDVVIYNYPMEMFVHNWDEIKEIAEIHEKLYRSENIDHALRSFFNLGEENTNLNATIFSSSALYQLNQIQHGYYKYRKGKISNDQIRVGDAYIKIYPVPDVYVRYLLTTKLKDKLGKEDIEKISQKVCEYINGSKYLNYATLFEEVCMYE